MWTLLAERAEREGAGVGQREVQQLRARGRRRGRAAQRGQQQRRHRRHAAAGRPHAAAERQQEHVRHRRPRRLPEDERRPATINTGHYTLSANVHHQQNNTYTLLG